MFSDGGSTPPASTISACPRGPRCTKMHRGPFLFAGLQSHAVPVYPCLCHSSTLYLGVHWGAYLSIPKQVPPDVPLVMQLLGRDTVTGKAAAQGGIYAAPHVFDGTHPNMTPEMWKQIPAAMADPIAVFDSDSPAGRARGDLVFMLELTDANGATVVVPVALQAKGKLGARINIVKSAYAKESGGVPSNNGFIRQAKKMPAL